MLTATERAALAAARADDETAKKGGWRACLLFWSCGQRGRGSKGLAARRPSHLADRAGDSKPDDKEAKDAGRVTVVCASADGAEPQPQP